jgi:Ca2+-binding RTX toxin-like protein
MKDLAPHGDAGDDFLRGGKGNDIVEGGEGKDTIFGDMGDDVLIGGAGSDLFVSGAGADTIKDFTLGTDHLLVSVDQLNAIYRGELALTNQSGDLHIDFGNGSSVTLDGVTVKELETVGIDNVFTTDLSLVA